MDRVPVVLDEAIDEFAAVFGRRPVAAFSSEHTDDADVVLVACSTMAGTARQVVEARRAHGEKVGLVRAKLFRPFLREEFARAIGSARRVAVLDRNHSPGSGGILWTETATSLRDRPFPMLQDYIVGLGGTDVVPAVVESVLDDISVRETAVPPVFIDGVAS